MKTKLGVEWRSLKSVNGKCTLHKLHMWYLLILSLLATIYIYTFNGQARYDSQNYGYIET